MKKMRRNFSLYRLVLSAVCLVFVVTIIILSVVSDHIIMSLTTQQAAQRWDAKGKVSQISCFYSVDSGITMDRIEEFEHKLEEALVEASIEPAKPGARLWMDAYSAKGHLLVKSERSSITVDAFGIGGDFFSFHPLVLKSGSYFSGNDLLQDYCVLDEVAAWKLFGSNDVAGQMVTIGDKIHIVSGVIENEDSKWLEESGGNGSTIYVSLDTLNKYGSSQGIRHYEIVMPNPVKGYALDYVSKNIGASQTQVELIENTTRYDWLSRVKHIGKLSLRAINEKAIIYPYWENIARVYEDKLAVLMLVQLVLASLTLIIAGGFLIHAWKHKKWTIRSIWNAARNKWEESVSFHRKKKRLQQQKED